MIRRATASDTRGVFGLMSAYVRPVWTEAQVSAALTDESCDVFVADEDGSTVGYIVLENVLDEGCVSSIAVSPDHRRRGIARALFETAIAARRPASVYLEVNEHNSGAIAFYGSLGFVKAGERKKYYGEDSAFIMRRERADI